MSKINANYENVYAYNLDNTYMTEWDPKKYASKVNEAENEELTSSLSGNKAKTNIEENLDDGSIGFWGATKNLAKGAWNFLTSPFKNDRGEWSLLSTLKSAAIAGLFLAGNALTGGALTPILLATGAIAGVWGAGKAAYNIATAKTDAQAEAAWQSMGSSAATIATTVVGARSYAKSSAIAEGIEPNKYNGLNGTARAVGKTFSDSYKNINSGRKYLFGQSAKEATINADGTIAEAARPEIQGKVQQKFGQLKDSYNNSTKETWYGKAADVARQEKNAIQQKGKNFIAKNSDKYTKHITENPSKKITVKEKFNILTETVRNIAKKEFAPQLGYQKGKGFLGNTEAILTNPQNLAIHNNLTSQTVKPNFYDSLSKEEQEYYDSLTKEQQEQLEDIFYSMV